MKNRNLHRLVTTNAMDGGARLVCVVGAHCDRKNAHANDVRDDARN